MQTTTIYMFGFSKERSHLDVSFEYQEEIKIILFPKFANLPRLMIYPIIRIQQKNYKKQTICEPKRQISHNLKTKQHLAMQKLGAVLINILGRQQ